MHKIGIIGHDTFEFLNGPDLVYRIVQRTVELLSYQYGPDLVFNIPGNIGVGFMAAQALNESNHKYHLFVPCPLPQTGLDWYDDQRELLKEYYNKAYTITTCYSNAKDGKDFYKNIVDDSSFLVAFWSGKKQGKTFEAIKHALKKQKHVFNAMSELRLVTIQDTGVFK